MDLFDDMPFVEDLKLKDGDVRIWRHVTLRPSGQNLFDALVKGVAWEQRSIVLWGQERKQPRLTAWYGDPGKSYKYSGTHFEPLPWSELLGSLRDQVENIVHADFNSVLLNLYRNNDDSMGLHSDDEPELGPRPTIASLSLGAERIFTLKHKTLESEKAVKINLPSESLLLMSGLTQNYWKHGISKQSTTCGARINLTFRKII